MSDAESFESTVQRLSSALLIRPLSARTAAAALPRAAGLYAWWAPPSVLPGLPGPLNTDAPDQRLLYLGTTTHLHRRIASEDLKRSGGSTLRRTLAGLLMPTEGYRTTRKSDRVVLLPDDEPRLTAWMHRHLALTWVEHSAPQPVKDELISRLNPPLNLNGTAQSPVRDRVRETRAAYSTNTFPHPG